MSTSPYAFWQRWLMLVNGAILLGAASGMVVASRLGYDPYSSAVVALSSRLDVSLTVASLMLFAILIALAAQRVRPSIGGTVVVSVVLSVTLGVVSHLLGEPGSFAARLALSIGSLVPAGIGIVFYLSAHLGASPTDSLALAIASSRIRYPAAMTVVFVGFCVFAWVVDRVLPGWNTILSLTCMGPTVSITRRICERLGLVGFPNEGPTPTVARTPLEAKP